MRGDIYIDYPFEDVMFRKRSFEGVLADCGSAS
ncbi:hypothetical protein [Ralstonia pseudosolanacearum]